MLTFPRLVSRTHLSDDSSITHTAVLTPLLAISRKAVIIHLTKRQIWILLIVNWTILAPINALVIVLLLEFIVLNTNVKRNIKLNNF